MPDKRRYADRAKYNALAVAKRRRKIREMAVAHKGGRCEICGYDRSPRALSFHHRDPAQKEFGLSDRGLTRSWDRVRREIEKCVLLCANCHMEVHDGVTQLPGESRVEK